MVVIVFWSHFVKLARVTLILDLLHQLEATLTPLGQLIFRYDEEHDDSKPAFRLLSIEFLVVQPHEFRL
jgi:hypothetical protein